jgi:hypothetical protein
LILIVERDLSLVSGHHHTQIGAIRSLAPSQQVFVATTVDFALADDVHADDIFAILPSRNILRSASLFRTRRSPKSDWATSAASALSAKVAALGMSHADQIVIPSCRPVSMRMLFQIYDGNSADRRPRAKLRILSPDVLSRLSANEVLQLGNHVKSGRIWLYTETAELAQFITQQTGLPCSAEFVLPATIPVNQAPTAAAAHTVQQKDHFTIGCLGQARRGKGSFDIPRIVGELRKLAARQSCPFSITILVQKPRGKRWKHARFQLEESLTRNVFPRATVEVLQSDLSPAEFRSMLESVDFLMLPYWVSRYGLRGSGLVTDGILAHKPILHTEGMSMQEFLSHGNGESATTPHEFAAKILSMCSTLRDFETPTGTAARYLTERIAATGNTLNEN